MIKLNHKTPEAARYQAGVYQTPQDFGQTAAKGLSDIAGSVSKIVEFQNKQYNSSQNQLGRTSFANWQIELGARKDVLEKAMKGGNVDEINVAQESFNQLKKFDPNMKDEDGKYMFLPENPGAEVTSKNIVNNYQANAIVNWDATNRSLNAKRDMYVNLRLVDDKNTTSEAGWTDLNQRYGVDGYIPLTENLAWLDTTLNAKDDLDFFNAIDSPDNKNGENYVKGQLAKFDRSAERALANAITPEEVQSIAEKYQERSANYPLFNKVPNHLENLQTYVEDRLKAIQANQKAIFEAQAGVQMEVLGAAMTTLFNADNQNFTSLDVLPVEQVIRRISGDALIDPNDPSKGTYPDLRPYLSEADQIKFADALIYEDFVTPDTAEDGSLVDSDFIEITKAIVATKPENRVSADQFWAVGTTVKVDGEDKPILKYNIAGLSKAGRTQLANHVKARVDKIDNLMSSGDVATAMAELDHDIREALLAGKPAEANLIFQEKYINNDFFYNRPNMPTMLANISVPNGGFELDDDPDVAKTSIKSVIANNPGNLVALRNNIATAIMKPSNPNLTDGILNTYYTLNAILPSLIENPNLDLDSTIAALHTGVANYMAADDEDPFKKKTDKEFSDIMNHQRTYQSDGGFFGGEGMKSKRQLALANNIDLYVRLNKPVMAEYYRNLLKGQLYNYISTNKKGNRDEAVKSIATFERERLKPEQLVPIDTFGGNEYNAVLPHEFDEFVIQDLGNKQWSGFGELYRGLFDRDSMALGKKQEYAHAYSMFTLATYLVGNDNLGIRDFIEKTGFEFDMNDNTLYNKNTNQFTRKGFRGFLRGMMKNKTPSGQDISMIGGTEYVYKNGEIVKVPTVHAIDNAVFTKLENKDPITVDELVDLTSELMDGENDPGDWRLPFTQPNEFMDRVLDILEDKGYVSEEDFFDVGMQKSRGLRKGPFQQTRGMDIKEEYFDSQ